MDDRYPSIGVMMQGIKGVTGTGGASNYADMLVKLDEDGRLPDGALPEWVTAANLDRAYNRITELYDKVENAESAVGSISTIETAVSSLENFQTSASGRIDSLESEVSELKQEILEPADPSDENLWAKVDAAKTAATAALSDVDALKTEVGEHSDGDTRTVFQRLSSLESELGSGSSGTTAFSRLSSVESQVEEHASAISENASDISEAAENIATLFSRVGSSDNAANASGSVFARIKDVTNTLGTNTDPTKAGVPLFNRVASLEGYIDNKRSSIEKIQSIESEVSELQSIEGSATGLRDAISTLQTWKNSASADMSTLSGRCDTLQSTLNSITGQGLSDLRTKVDAMWNALGMGDGNNPITTEEFTAISSQMNNVLNVVAELRAAVRVLYGKLVSPSITMNIEPIEDDQELPAASARTLGSVYVKRNPNWNGTGSNEFDEYVTMSRESSEASDGYDYYWEKLGPAET